MQLRCVPALPCRVVAVCFFAYHDRRSEAPSRRCGWFTPAILRGSTAPLLCRRRLPATAALVSSTCASPVHTPCRAFTDGTHTRQAPSAQLRGVRRGRASHRGSTARGRGNHAAGGHGAPSRTVSGSRGRQHDQHRPHHTEARADDADAPDTHRAFTEQAGEGVVRDAAGEPGAAAHANNAAGPAPAPPRDDEQGWGLETVDAQTGRTALEALYDRHLERIRAVLEKPLPALPQDGSVEPDFFVGFASYSYQLRDQYRAVLARELQVPVSAVRLSVAWSGRFDVRRFGRVQKVCGVCVDRQRCRAENEEVTDGPDSAAASTPTSPLPAALQRRIESLVAAINSRTREDLLHLQLFQASPPLPEVEFALTRRAHRVMYHLHEWVRRHVLQRAVVVVVYGVPPPRAAATTASSFVQELPGRRPREEQASSSESGSSAGAATATNKAGADARVGAVYAAWQERGGARGAEQLRVVQEQWLRLFHRRQVVPLVLSLTELATQLAVAVVRGEVPHVAIRDGDAALRNGTSGDEDAHLLDAGLEEVLTSVAAAATASSSVSGTELVAGAATSAAAKDVLLPTLQLSDDKAAAPLFGPTSAAQQESAMRWVRLVYEALFLREAQGVAGHETTEDAAPQTYHAATNTRTGTTAAATALALPALFAQGVYAGGQEEVAYLQHNRMAMDALLLHPHEISFKKKFVSRMRNGHRRLRMEEESAAPYSMDG